MTRAAFRKCLWVHTWSSLVCTLFLLLICISGLPLVLRHEINDAVLPSRNATTDLPADAPRISIDVLIDFSRVRFPGQLIAGIFVDDDEPHAFVSMVPSFEAAQANPRLAHWLKFDIRTGALINTLEQFNEDMKAPAPAFVSGFLLVMLRLHTDLFAKLPGQLFLGLMGLLMVVAIVSGAMLYGPFMKKLEFGTVRSDRSRRLRWLDLHNLIGVVTLAWMTVAGITGFINELSKPMTELWQGGVRAELGKAVHGNAPPPQTEMVSAQGAFDTVRRAMPGTFVQTGVFPSPASISVNHYLLWAKGDTPLTGRMMTAALVDARTGELTKILEMPWYLRALQISRPLHFGDFGGLPLKIIWALLDLMTIIVLGSGLYLWWTRRFLSSHTAEAALVESRAEVSSLSRRRTAE